MGSWIPPLFPFRYPAEPAQFHPLALLTQPGQGVGAGAWVGDSPGALCSPQLRHKEGEPAKVLNEWM